MQSSKTRYINISSFDFRAKYKISILTIDGNINLLKDFYKKDIDNYLNNYDIVCFEHPTKKHTLYNESRNIINNKLDTASNVNKIMKII